MKSLLEKISGTRIAAAVLITSYISLFLYSVFQTTKGSVAAVVFIIVFLVSLITAGVISFAGSKNSSRKKSLLFSFSLLVLVVLLYSVQQLAMWNPQPPEVLSGTLKRLKTIIDGAFYVFAVSGFTVSALQFITDAKENYAEGKGGIFRRMALRTIGLLLVLVLINLAAERRPFVIDLTGPGRYTLSDTGKNAISKIKIPIEITAFYPYFHDYQREIELMLKSIQSANPLITYRIVDALRDRKIGEELKIDRNGWVVLTAQNPGAIDPVESNLERKLAIRSQEDLRRMERDFVSSIIAITSKRKKIYFTTGSGENSSNGPFAEETISRFVDDLRRSNFSPVELTTTLGYPAELPKDADLIAIIGPGRNLPLRARENVIDYIKNGGSLFITLEPSSPNIFPELQSRLGVQYRGGRLLSDVHLKPEKSNIVITDYTSHPVTSRLVSLPPTEKYAVLPGSGSFISANNLQNALKVKIDYIAKSAEKSWLEIINDNKRNNNEPFEAFNVITAIEVRGDNQIGRVIAVADSDFIKNRYLDYGANNELALTSVKWLSDDPNLNGLIPPVHNETRINMAGGLDNIVFYSLVYIWPGLIFLAGIFIIRFRRKK